MLATSVFDYNKDIVIVNFINLAKNKLFSIHLKVKV